MIQNFRVNANACIVECEFGQAFVPVQMRDYLYASPFGHGLYAVVDDVHEDLLKTVAVSFDIRQVSVQVNRRCDAVLVQHWTDEPEHFAYKGVEVSGA